MISAAILKIVTGNYSEKLDVAKLVSETDKSSLKQPTKKEMLESILLNFKFFQIYLFTLCSHIIHVNIWHSPERIEQYNSSTSYHFSSLYLFAFRF